MNNKGIKLGKITDRNIWQGYQVSSYKMNTENPITEVFYHDFVKKSKEEKKVERFYSVASILHEDHREDEGKIVINFNIENFKIKNWKILKKELDFDRVTDIVAFFDYIINKNNVKSEYLALYIRNEKYVVKVYNSSSPKNSQINTLIRAILIDLGIDKTFAKSITKNKFNYLTDKYALNPTLETKPDDANIYDKVTFQKYCLHISFK